MEKQKEEQSKKVKELERQLEEEQQRRAEMEKKWSNMRVDDEEDEWEDYDPTNQWYKEDTKGSSSKDSSFVFVESTKSSPTINKVEEPAEDKDFDS